MRVYGAPRYLLVLLVVSSKQLVDIVVVSGRKEGGEWKRMKKILIEWARIFCLMHELSMAARKQDSHPGVAATGTCIRTK